MHKQCSVFISSTVEDLAEFRLAARDAILAAELRPEMMEYFAATGGPPLSECLARITPCDVLVVLLAHRYGWVPPDQTDQLGKSITWLECEHAVQERKEVLAFLLDPRVTWPSERTEAYRLTAAFNQGTFTPELPTEVQRNVAKLGEFRRWLDNGRIRATFTSTDDLRAKIIQALYHWTVKHAVPRPDRPHRADPSIYFEWLRNQTAWIDIRGLQVGTGRAHRFPIQELYIPLTTSAEPVGNELRNEVKAPVRLEEALGRPRLVIVGDPGSGKTTFLRRMTYELCLAAEQLGPGVGPRLELPYRAFPILIRIAELEQHILACSGRREQGAPTSAESPAWLSHFMAHRSTERGWNLDALFFEQRLREPSTVVLLDGLDEATNRVERESIARLFETATDTYRKCRFVVTTRPQAYTDRATLAGFDTVKIEDLGTQAVERFLERWSQCLYPDSAAAEIHWNELIGALHGRVEIRRMARNPVMLTALAVVHWNERRLPEQRADLYESIVTWLARSREQRAVREPADRCLSLLGHLALEMQTKSLGRLTQLSKGRAADMIAARFRDKPENERFACAQLFLDEEEVDSGIVVSRGTELRFWHLTFQEYLAARTLAGLPEAAQQKTLFDSERLYRPEWREVILLFAGTLLVKQGPEKVDGFINAVLDRVEHNAPLSEKAACAGLLGMILADLRPLSYQPADPRYQELLTAALGIFDARKSSEIPLSVRLEAAEALGLAGDPRLRQRNWVRIPAGTFVMGSQKVSANRPNYDPDAHDDECPDHEVQLEAFQIGRYPVTVEEYRLFVDDDGYERREWWADGQRTNRSQPDDWEEQLLHPSRPVVGVSWFEAVAYCAWRGGRLPTEAEWERAARGTTGRRYPWGNNRPDPRRANYQSAKIGHPTPVGLFANGRTPEGVYDLAGNVWEWVADWYAPDYTGPAEERLARVLRGCSWAYESRGLRAATRGNLEPARSLSNVGFRCALAETT